MALVDHRHRASDAGCDERHRPDARGGHAKFRAAWGRTKGARDTSSGVATGANSEVVLK